METIKSSNIEKQFWDIEFLLKRIF